MKKETIVTLISICLIISIFLIYKNLPSNKQPVKIYNTNESFVKEQEQNGIFFKHIECYYDGNESLISYTITNNTAKDIELKNYELYIKDKNDTVISKIFLNTNITLSPNEERKIENKVIGRDLSDAFKIELNTNVKTN